MVHNGRQSARASGNLLEVDMEEDICKTCKNFLSGKCFSCDSNLCNYELCTTEEQKENIVKAAGIAKLILDCKECIK